MSVESNTPVQEPSIPTMRTIFTVSAALVLSISAPASAEELTAEQWLDAGTAQLTATSSAIDIRLVRNRGPSQRSVVLETRMSHRAAGAVKTYILQLEPKLQAGSQFLTIVNGTEEEQYQLMPSVGSVTQITPNQNFSLFGTDFQIRDIAVADPTVGTHRVLRKETVPVQGLIRPVTVIESTYTTGKNRRVLRYLDDVEKLPLKVEYFADGGKLLKRLVVLEIAKNGSIPLAIRSRMENVLRGTHTDLIIEKHRFDLSEAELPESTFTKEHMVTVGKRFEAEAAAEEGGW